LGITDDEALDALTASFANMYVSRHLHQTTLYQRLVDLEKADVVSEPEIQALESDFNGFYKHSRFNKKVLAGKIQFVDNKFGIIQAKLHTNSEVELMPSIKETIKDIRGLLQNSSEQLTILSEYAVHEKDKEFMQKLVENINAHQPVYQGIKNKLATIEHMHFEGKGGTQEERTFLSGMVYRVVRFALDALSLLIWLVTFGQTNKLFPKTPTEEEHKIITKNKDALMATHAELKIMLDALSEKPDDGLMLDV